MSDDVEESLSLSIDLQAELVSITERQHLNKVHWAVQLMRHALEHRPLHVDVRVTAGMLELTHDGEALALDEHGLLLAVTGGPAEHRQEALAELEARFGVTLLSLLLTSARVELQGNLSLVAEGGRVSAGPPSSRPGYRLRVWRSHGPASRHVREEKAELRFYCRHCDVPITLNGKALNRPLTLQRALLSRTFRAEEGDGLIGLPARGTMTRLRYYKRGVYFGVRQSLPSDGRPVEACFDSTLTTHEDNFERSVEAANASLRVARRQLYDGLPALFPFLTPSVRGRVKDIVLGSAAKRLPSAIRGLPLFDTSLSSWRLSLEDLERLERRFGYVPYLLRATRGDDELPVLSTSEVAAVARFLGVPVRRALHFRRPGGIVAAAVRKLRALLVSGRPPGGRPLPHDLLDEDTRALLEALAREQPDVRIVVTDGGRPRLRRGPVRRMYLPSTEPVLRRAVARYRERPEELDVIGASLLLSA